MYYKILKNGKNDYDFICKAEIENNVWIPRVGVD